MLSTFTLVLFPTLPSHPAPMSPLYFPYTILDLLSFKRYVHNLCDYMKSTNHR